MGSFKPLLTLEGKSFIISIINKLHPFCEKIGIVTGFNAAEVVNEINQFMHNSDLNKIELFHNPDFETGMFSSLQTGLKKMIDCDWLLYHFVDQPHIPEKFYSDFITQIDDGYDWIQAEYNHKKGHPILLNKSIFQHILDSDNDSLKEISCLPEIKKKILKCEYPQIIEDIDTQEDYQKLT